MERLKRTSRVRLLEVNDTMTGQKFRIEIKGFFGWKQPEISYAGDGEFYDRAEAEKWFKYLSTGKRETTNLIKQK